MLLGDDCLTNRVHVASLEARVSRELRAKEAANFNYDGYNMRKNIGDLCTIDDGFQRAQGKSQ